MCSVLWAMLSSLLLICLLFSVSRDHLYQKLTFNYAKRKRSFTSEKNSFFCGRCFRILLLPKILVLPLLCQFFAVFCHSDHCFLLEQHESATRSLDDNVWEEFRNFKKCLIMMFAKQEKDLIFLETVMSLARQKRHCLVECIPLPKEVAKQAPLYFKKVCKTIVCCPFYFYSTVYQI